MTRTDYIKRNMMPAPENEGSDIFEIGDTYRLLMLWLLENRKNSASMWADGQWNVGYKQTSSLQWELIVGRAIDRLILEIRAMRGVDELTPGYDNPSANPFTLDLGHIEKVAVRQEATNAKLEEIRTILAAMQASTDIAEIRDGVNLIGVLLS